MAKKKFDKASKNIDSTLWKDAECSSELDYVAKLLMQKRVKLLKPSYKKMKQKIYTFFYLSITICFFFNLNVQATADQANIEALLNRASKYESNQQYKKAAETYELILKRQEKSLGPNHLEIANTLDNLARALRQQARYKEAEPLYKRALEIKAKNGRS